MSRTAANMLADPTPAAEPWWLESVDESDRDGWMLSYLDILTLLLTLFVVIIAITHAELQKRVLPPVLSPTTADTSVAGKTGTPTTPPIAAAATAVSTELAAPTPAPIAAPPLEPPRALSSFSETITAAATPDVEASAIAAVVNPVTPSLTSVAAEAAPVSAPAPALIVASTMAPENARDIENAKTPEMTVQQRMADDKSAFASLDRSGSMQVQVEERGVMIELGEDVLFTPASAQLASQSVPALDALATILAEMPYVVWIEGHTDDSPIATSAFPSNWELSTARATTVMRYLASHGLAPHRLRVVGLGDTQPRSSNDTAQGRSENRRVVFRIEMPPAQPAH